RRLSHPNNVSFPPRTPGSAQCPGLHNFKGLHTHIPSSSEFSTSSSHSEQSFNPLSPGLSLGRICMGRPYNSRCVETSHLMRDPKVARKPTYHRSNPHCLLCTDHPSCPSSPTFLDQLIKGINYLDRSTNAFCNNYPKSLSLPHLAATYLERAANSLYLDQLDNAPPHSYSTLSASVASPDHSPNTTSLVPSTQDINTLQYLGSSNGMSCQHQPYNQNFSSKMPQRSGIKLPELPLFGNGLFSLGHLPKFWEAMRLGWSAPVEPVSKPSDWW
ncbi:uncharacterized protein LOC103746434, partial [Nannospalax galili]|uniref:uncharacterized protein LOC103746434 n=1 Tax=Nannospalax galili TaxID=1026970 RepID=UPI00081A038D